MVYESRTVWDSVWLDFFRKWSALLRNPVSSPDEDDSNDDIETQECSSKKV